MSQTEVNNCTGQISTFIDRNRDRQIYTTRSKHKTTIYLQTTNMKRHHSFSTAVLSHCSHVLYFYSYMLHSRSATGWWYYKFTFKISYPLNFSTTKKYCNLIITYDIIIPLTFLADRTNGRAYATVLRLSVVVVCLSVTSCIAAKRCVLEQKLLLRAYRKSVIKHCERQCLH